MPKAIKEKNKQRQRKLTKRNQKECMESYVSCVFWL